MQGRALMREAEKFLHDILACRTVNIIRNRRNQLNLLRESGSCEGESVTHQQPAFPLMNMLANEQKHETSHRNWALPQLTTGIHHEQWKVRGSLLVPRYDTSQSCCRIAFSQLPSRRDALPLAEKWKPRCFHQW